MSPKDEEKVESESLSSTEAAGIEATNLESGGDAPSAASSAPAKPKRKRKTAPKADSDSESAAPKKPATDSSDSEAAELEPKKPRRRRSTKSATAVLEDESAPALTAEYISAAAEHAAQESTAQDKGATAAKVATDSIAEAPKRKRRTKKAKAEQAGEAEAIEPDKLFEQSKISAALQGGQSGDADVISVSVFDEESINAALQAAAVEKKPKRRRSSKKSEKSTPDEAVAPFNEESAALDNSALYAEAQQAAAAPESMADYQAPASDYAVSQVQSTETATMDYAASQVQSTETATTDYTASQVQSTETAITDYTASQVQSTETATTEYTASQVQSTETAAMDYAASQVQSVENATPENNASEGDGQGERDMSEPPEEDFKPKRREGFLHWAGVKIYRKLSLIGMRCIKSYLYFYRRFRILMAVFAMLSQYFKKKIIYSLRLFSVRNGLSFDFIIDILRTLRTGGRAARKKGAWALVKYWATALSTLAAQGFMRLVSSINYVAPFLALTVFIVVINSTLNMTFALKVDYNGEEIGYISDESVYEKAEKQMLGRIVFEDYIKPENSVPRFTITAVRVEQLLSEDELTDKLIQASGNELAEAAGLYIDDRFYGAIGDRRTLVKILDSVKARFRSDDADNEEVDFIKNVEVRNGLYPVSSVVDEQRMLEITNREEQGERIYITQEGDAPILIAQKNGIPYSQLKALNPDIEKSLLVGQEILISKSVPLLEVKVTRLVTTEEETNFKIEQIQDSTQYQGYVKITQTGKTGLSRVTREITYIDGIETDSEIIDTVVIREPVNERVVVGGKMPLAQIPQSAHSTSSNFIWPVAGGYVSCGINGYWGHTGMDIAANTGTAVYASAAGTVTKAVYNYTGYGFHVIINHGGGVETLYGHNSKLHVKVGDWVEQGQLIASIGMTGRASGPHCHFEVRINGRYMDPAKYIGTRNPYT